jgi:chorismate mutase
MPNNDAVSRPSNEAASTREALEALRRDIDALDDAMLALVEKRVAAAMGIAELKRSDGGDRLRLRPAREAAVVERLVGQARVSPNRLVRSIWREIMSSCLDLQVHTELALHAAARPAAMVDAMRRRFGGAAEMIVTSSPAEALDAARTREAVAVIELEPTSDWWCPLRDDSSLAIFDVIRDEQGGIIGLAIGRIAAEDLAACPQIRIVEPGVGSGERLASAGGLQLMLIPSEAGR